MSGGSSAASAPTPTAALSLPPTLEELQGWIALLRYIKNGNQADLLKVAINVADEELSAASLGLPPAMASYDLAKEHLSQALQAAEDALASHDDDAGLRPSLDHLVHMVRLDAAWRAHIDGATKNIETIKRGIQELQESRDSHIGQKQMAENILRTTQSIGVFPCLDPRKLAAQLREILQDPSFSSIQVIAFIPVSSCSEEKQTEVYMNTISAEAENGGRRFEIRAPASPPSSPTPPTPTPSPPRKGARIVSFVQDA